jgi:iron uptake system component EfeO
MTPVLVLRNMLCLASVAGLALFASACGSGDDVPADAHRMSFQITDAGCVPNQANAPAGPISFEVENTGTSRVSEFEVLDGDNVLGEVENVTDGLDGQFSLDLEAGDYTLYCPGGEKERGTLRVSG